MTPTRACNPVRLTPRELRRLLQCGKRYVVVFSAMMWGLAGCHETPNPEPVHRNPELELAQAALQDVGWHTIDGADVARGMQVVVGTHGCQTSSNCFSCYQCHGFRGKGSALASFPRLTGQSYVYLHQALKDFASGRRRNPTMQAVVLGLTAQQMKDVAAYYAAMTPALPPNLQPQRNAAAEVVAKGRELAVAGSSQPTVQACATCHGAQGARPATEMYPYLASQHPDYIERQLKAFRAGERRDPLRIMEHVASQMNDEQMHAVAQYYGSLPLILAKPAVNKLALTNDDKNQELPVRLE